ncbi:hypothetical protein JKF63_07549 [Porcisia hertigi]|uniref:C2H2-type domain-containing protein n=1 Tax=Porcisia hertigi TaxID=2761500 RepID=A0A836YI15_9TRYP|nr:hypothetical protein JKF63_07549 [Porcisia hertigi]
MQEDIGDEANHRIGPATPVLPDPLTILLVGEGNLSFTYALIRRLSRSAAVRRATQSDVPPDERRHGSVVRVIATTFDNVTELHRKYPETVGFLAYFSAKQRVSVRYYGDVNATSLLSAPVSLRNHPCHLLMFNNPHIGFEDLYRQRSLLSHFFHSARELYRASATLDSPQEIVVTLCDDQARRWDLLGCAARSGYICVAAVLLRAADFPEYTNRRHQSDAAFPFGIMVQYYFVLFQAELHEVLLHLSAEVSLWTPERSSSLDESPPRREIFSEWLAVAHSSLGSCAQSVKREAEFRESVPIDTFVSTDEDFSVNSSATFLQQPLPLLHPTLVARVVAQVVLGSCFAHSSGHRGEAFMPYLPSSTWASLYRAQRLAEEHRRTSDPAAPAMSPMLPPQLDTSILGRPLTAREAKKLERYLSGYGAAMKAGAEQRRQAASAASCTWRCETCQPPRVFQTEEDMRQHRLAKHTSAPHLAPTLYARVHKQIEAPRDPLAMALDEMRLEDRGATDYCDICGLQFKSCDAYEEHLRYLSPLPGDAAADLVCNLCQPPKSFTDRRALEQHQATKHESAD